MIFAAQGVAGLRKLEANQRNDITRPGFGNFLPFLRMDLHDAANALVFFLRRIEDLHPASQSAGENPCKGLLSNVRIMDQFECESRKRFFRRRMACMEFFRIVQVGTGYSAFINRRREVIGDCVEDQLNSLILICGSAENGRDKQFQCGFAGNAFQQFGRYVFFIKEHLHNLFIEFGNLLNNFSPGLFDLCLVFFRDGNFYPLKFLKPECFPLYYVDYPVKIFFFSHLNLEGECIGIKVFVHLFYHCREIGSYPVHFVDESNTGYTVAVGLVPHCLTLGLNAANGAKNRYHPVDNAE